MSRMGGRKGVLHKLGMRISQKGGRQSKHYKLQKEGGRELHRREGGRVSITKGGREGVPQEGGVGNIKGREAGSSTNVREVKNAVI
jgi:hypothetical protein